MVILKNDPKQAPFGIKNTLLKINIDFNVYKINIPKWIYENIYKGLQSRSK